MHPKTGKICVPFLAEQVDQFDLSKVPTVTSIRSDEGREELQKAINILEQLATACAWTRYNSKMGPNSNGTYRQEK